MYVYAYIHIYIYGSSPYNLLNLPTLENPKYATLYALNPKLGFRV